MISSIIWFFSLIPKLWSDPTRPKKRVFFVKTAKFVRSIFGSLKMLRLVFNPVELANAWSGYGHSESIWNRYVKVNKTRYLWWVYSEPLAGKVLRHSTTYEVGLKVEKKIDIRGRQLSYMLILKKNIRALNSHGIISTSYSSRIGTTDLAVFSKKILELLTL